jgi:hypothetical protein
MNIVGLELSLLISGDQFTNTAKPADAVTPIKQSPVLKGHLFLVLSWKISYE